VCAVWATCQEYVTWCQDTKSDFLITNHVIHIGSLCFYTLQFHDTILHLLIVMHRFLQQRVMPSALLHCQCGNMKDIPACKKASGGVPLVVVWLELCTSSSSRCYHHRPPPSSFAALKSRTVWHSVRGLPIFVPKLAAKTSVVDVVASKERQMDSKMYE